MAGIEKVCELTGNVCDWEMYEWKRNSIQISKQSRKLFRGCDAILTFNDSTRRFYFKDGGSLDYDEDEEYIENYCKNLGHVKTEYNYSLRVSDKHLQGVVYGVYTNWSANKSTVIRKLRRLTRNYQLEVINLEDI